jgi:hypothetical protein
MPVCFQRNFLLVSQFNTDNFEVVFGNDLFGAKSLNWAAQDFVSIYLYYSSSFKHLMIVKSSEDQQQLYKKLTFNQFYMLIENLITILFDGRLFPVYYIKALEEFKMLMEALKREIDTNHAHSFIIKDLIQTGETNAQRYSRYSELLSRLLDKMIMQMKITRDQVRDLTEYLAGCVASDTPDKEAKSIEDVLFRDIPRLEECQSEEVLEEKIMNFIDKSETLLNDDTSYFYHNNQRTKPSPLLEDREGFIMNSFTINSKYKTHIQSFIEENIYKRIYTLNEITSMLFLELVNINFDPRSMQGRTSYYVHEPCLSHLQPKPYVYQTYSDKELDFLQQMYKLNLEIFMALNQDTKNLKDNLDMLRFNCNLFERVDRERDVRMDQRQLYMMLSDNLPIILTILKNFVRNVDIYPQLFYVFFDCFCGTDFLQQVINFERQTAAGTQQQPQSEKFTGLFMLSLLSKLFIKYLMVMFNKLPEKLDQFHFLYDKDINIHYFFLKILKFIFRTIKLKEENNKSYAAELINQLRRHIFKLIMVALKLSSRLN